MKFILLSDNEEVKKHGGGQCVAAIMWLVDNYGCSHLQQSDYYGGALYYPDNIGLWEKWSEVGNKLKDSDEWVWSAETHFKCDEYFNYWRRDTVTIRDPQVCLLFNLQYGHLITINSNA